MNPAGVVNVLLAMWYHRAWSVPLAAVLTLAGGCSSTVDDAAAVTRTFQSPRAATAMVCQQEAESDITGALGLPPSQAPTSSWSDQLFTCVYRYGDSVMVVSVKELADPVAARAYFGQQKTSATDSVAFPDMGDAAFITNAGSTYVLKSASVLRVDVSRMPDTLGPNHVPRNHVGIAVASVILGCWVGD